MKKYDRDANDLDAPEIMFACMVACAVVAWVVDAIVIICYTLF